MKTWLTIEGSNGQYEVSDEGDVAKIINGERVLLKPYENNSGYMRIKLTLNGKRKAYYVHRLVCSAFHPNHNNLPEVDHINRNRKGNWANNLRWVTREENLLNRGF